MSNNNNEIARKFNVHIADNTGHTTIAEQEMEQTMEHIINNVEANARFPYINGVPFHFEGTNYRSEMNMQSLRQALLAAEDAEVLLTGQLKGGNR
jgi:hypothetical protein